MLILDFLLDVVGYAFARFLLPAITSGHVKVDTLHSREMGFNWLGYKRVEGKILLSSTMAG